MLKPSKLMRAASYEGIQMNAAVQMTGAGGGPIQTLHIDALLLG
jgi:hypothetical protein